MGRALLLNASFEPLCVVPMRRAVVLVLKDKAEIIARNGGELHSERAALPIPSVIRLVHFVRVPFRNRVPLSRRASQGAGGNERRLTSPIARLAQPEAANKNGGSLATVDQARVKNAGTPFRKNPLASLRSRSAR